MRFRTWFIAFVALNLVAAILASIVLSESNSGVRMVLGLWVLGCTYKLTQAIVTRVHVVEEQLVFRDRLLRRRRVAISNVNTLTYLANELLEVSMDDGSRLRVDPRVMEGVPAFIERLSGDVTRHRVLLVKGDLS